MAVVWAAHVETAWNATRAGRGAGSSGGRSEHSCRSALPKLFGFQPTRARGRQRSRKNTIPVRLDIEADTGLFVVPVKEFVKKPRDISALSVIPAKAGISIRRARYRISLIEIPAFAGMTERVRGLFTRSKAGIQKVHEERSADRVLKESSGFSPSRE